jgi:hypothetical protein
MVIPAIHANRCRARSAAFGARPPVGGTVTKSMNERVCPVTASFGRIAATKSSSSETLSGTWSAPPIRPITACSAK